MTFEMMCLTYPYNFKVIFTIYKLKISRKQDFFLLVFANIYGKIYLTSKKEMSFINRNLFIDAVAYIGKTYIEKSDNNSIIKDIGKFTVDLIADHFKQSNNLDISSIRAEAKRCDVEKVVAIPCYMFNGNKTIFLKAYGGNHEKFFERLGLPSIPKESCDTICELVNSFEDKYGIEIYNVSINQGVNHDKL